MLLKGGGGLGFVKWRPTEIIFSYVVCIKIKMKIVVLYICLHVHVSSTGKMFIRVIHKHLLQVT